MVVNTAGCFVMATGLRASLEKLGRSKSFQKHSQNALAKSPKLIKDATDKEGERYTKEFKEILQRYMNWEPMKFGTLLGDDYGNITLQEDRVDPDGTVHYYLTFDNGLNLSPSILDPSTEVILPRLLNAGFSTNGNWGFGTWQKHQMRVATVTDRAGLGFIQEAIREFNAIHAKDGVQAMTGGAEHEDNYVY